MCCSVLQCDDEYVIAMELSVPVLQCVAVRCSALQCVAVCCSALQCVAARCSVTMNTVIAIELPAMLQCVAVCCSVLQCVAAW